MRPFVSFFTFFSFFSAAALVAARTETISGLDKQINFVGKWNGIDSPGGPFAYIKRGPGKASLKLINASSIAVTVMAERPDDTIGITLDNKDYVTSNFSAQQPAWSSSLDPTVPHTITVTKQNPDGRYTAIYSFIVTYPDSLANTTDTASLISGQSTSSPDEAGTSSTPNEAASPLSTSSALSAQQSNTEPILSGAKLAGVIVGCITVPVIIIGIFLYRRRIVNKRKAASTAYWEYMVSRAQQPSGPKSPPTPPDESFDGVQTKEMP